MHVQIYGQSLTKSKRVTLPCDLRKNRSIQVATNCIIIIQTHVVMYQINRSTF